ncbi:hypothetical protein MANES_06G067500v8 [Manihot esculenta]|uniref:Uncharacterized protein n=1 Tax=Manihot esculenta TaxID=3983 RepID=A0A2C9VNH8_MANES|nr:hypothetical protein MANES_06G067500v8 [Manihot esculenta]
MGSAYESKQRSHSVTGVRKGFEGCQTLMSHPKLRVLPELCQSYGEIYWHLIIFSFKKKTTVQKLSFSNGKQIGLGCEMTAIVRNKEYEPHIFFLAVDTLSKLDAV